MKLCTHCNDQPTDINTYPCLICNLNKQKGPSPPLPPGKASADRFSPKRINTAGRVNSGVGTANYLQLPDTLKPKKQKEKCPTCGK